MKTRFKVGDLVEIKEGAYKGRVGKVVWFGNGYNVELVKHSKPLRYYSQELKLAETPIERIKRRYEESI